MVVKLELPDAIAAGIRFCELEIGRAPADVELPLAEVMTSSEACME